MTDSLCGSLVLSSFLLLLKRGETKNIAAAEDIYYTTFNFITERRPKSRKKIKLMFFHIFSYCLYCLLSKKSNTIYL